MLEESLVFSLELKLERVFLEIEFIELSNKCCYATKTFRRWSVRASNQSNW